MIPEKSIFGIDPDILKQPFSVADIEIEIQGENGKTIRPLVSVFKKHNVPYDHLLPYVIVTALNQYAHYVESAIENKLRIRHLFKKVSRITFWLILVVALISFGMSGASALTGGVL